MATSTLTKEDATKQQLFHSRMEWVAASVLLCFSKYSAKPGEAQISASLLFAEATGGRHDQVGNTTHIASPQGTMSLSETYSLLRHVVSYGFTALPSETQPIDWETRPIGSEFERLCPELNKLLRRLQGKVSRTRTAFYANME